MYLLIAFSCQRLGCILAHQLIYFALLITIDIGKILKPEGWSLYFYKSCVYSFFLIDLPVECDDVGIICTGIVCKNGSFIFVNVYRAPGVSVECKENYNKLVNGFYYIATLYRNSRLSNPVITIVGYFNLPDVNWESGLAPDDGVQLSEYFFLQRVYSI